MNASVEYSEEVQLVGESQSMVAIVTSPVVQPDAKKPVVILVNAGMLHRVGPCRNTVILARLLAESGYRSIRFDYAGTGDSGASSGGAGSGDNIEQIKTVMDHAGREFGARRFIVHGLCSGARDAFHVAVADERVVGVGQIDSFSYRIARFQWNRLLEKIRKPSTWLHSILVRLRPTPTEAEDGDDLSTTVWPAYPPREELAQKYRKLLERGVLFFSVYTGSWSEVYNYQRQHFDMFAVPGLENNTELVYLPRADHLFSDPGLKRKVYQDFTAFVRSVDELLDTP